MDRYPKEKDRHRSTRLRSIMVLLAIITLSLCCDILYAETPKEKESKIELEKEEIFGILERPNVIFPVHWRDPEGPEERPFKLERSFREEIFDFVDMETFYYGRTYGDFLEHH